MHILVIPSWYPQTNSDFNGVFFKEQAVAIARAGHKVGVLSLCFRSLRRISSFFGRYGSLDSVEDGVVVFRYYGVNFAALFPKLNALRWRFVGLVIFRRYIAVHGVPDVIHVQSVLYAGVIAKYIMEKYGVPYVLTEHSSAIERLGLSPAKKFIFNDVCVLAARRVAVSRRLSAFLEKKTDMSWLVIPNGVNRIFFDVGDLRSSASDFVFLAACFFSENKRVDFIIKAFSELCEEGYPVRLRLIGDGLKRADYERYVGFLGVSDRVDFLGVLDRCSIAKEMASANVFLLASEYETFGLVVAESLAVGTPVICTRCGGPDDMVNQFNGFLVGVDDFSGYVRAMKSIYLGWDEFAPDLIRRDCESRFSDRSVAAVCIGLFKEVIDGL